MTRPPSPPRWLAPLGFALPLLLYVSTAARTIQGGDAGEFGLIGMIGGVPHPPGYPLFVLLARTMSLIPINPPYFRMALVSATAGAAAAGVVQQVAWRLTGNPWIALLTGLAFATTEVQWRLSGIPEVFALHALLVALAMLTTVRVLQAQDDEVLDEVLWLGLALGLGMANHMTMIFCAPMAVGALSSVSVRGRSSWPRAFGVLIASGLAGMSPYLLLLGWGRLDPLKAWVWGNTGTWDGLRHHLLREDYGTFQLSVEDNAASRKGFWLRTFLSSLPREYAYAFFAAGVIGLVASVRRPTMFGIALLASFALAGGFFPLLIRLGPGALGVEVAERFFLMPIVLFSPFIALGLQRVFEILQKGRAAGRPPPLPARAFGPILLAVLIASAARTRPFVDWSSDPTIERYLSAVVSDLPRDAVLIGQGDTVLPGFGWVDRVLHVRPDVRYVDAVMLSQRWYYDLVRRRIPQLALEYRNEPVHAGELALMLAPVAPTYVSTLDAGQVRESATLEPAGLVYRVVSNRPATPDQNRAHLEKAMARVGPLPAPIDAWSAEVQQAVAAPWKELLRSYRTAGKTAEYEAVLREAADALPPDPADVQ